MKKIQRITLLIGFAFAALLSNGCKKEAVQSATATTVEQDKQSIKASLDQLSSCVTQMRDGEGVQTIVKFLNLKEGEVLSEDWVSDIISKLDSVLGEENSDQTKFDFNYFTGTYTWNQSSKTWAKVKNTNSQIILQFPASEASAINNAVLTFEKYQDRKVVMGGEENYLPTLFSVNLKVDGIEVFSVNGSAEYMDPIPVDVKLAVVLKPFSYTLTGKRVSSKNFTSSFVITNGSGCNTSMNLEAELLHDDYENFDIDNDLSKVTSTITNGNLKIVSNIDAQSLVKIDEPTVSEVNAYVKTNVFINDQKVGELVVFEGSDKSQTLHLVYKDGTEEDVEVYYTPFLKNLEVILKPLFGEVNLD